MHLKVQKKNQFMYKFISWNVNGLRAVAGKGFADIFTELDADFFCLQETKLQAGQIDLEFLGYKSYWNYAEKKGYSGTAIYTKHEPLSVTYGIGVDEHDHEGRVVTLEMEDFYLVCVYVPNSQDGLIQMVLEQRKAAKAAKDWATSDKIRDDLKTLGIHIKDGKDGTEWTLE